MLSGVLSCAPPGLPAGVQVTAEISSSMLKFHGPLSGVLLGENRKKVTDFPGTLFGHIIVDHHPPKLSHAFVSMVTPGGEFQGLKQPHKSGDKQSDWDGTRHIM